MPRFGSEDWLAAFTDAVDGLEVEGPDIAVGQVFGDLAYVISVRGGRAAVVESGPDADVTLHQDLAGAAAIAAGDRNALDAFAAGELRVEGDVTRLREARPLFDAIESATAALRAETTF